MNHSVDRSHVRSGLTFFIHKAARLKLDLVRYYCSFLVQWMKVGRSVIIWIQKNSCISIVQITYNSINLMY